MGPPAEVDRILCAIGPAASCVAAGTESLSRREKLLRAISGTCILVLLERRTRSCPPSRHRRRVRETYDFSRSRQLSPPTFATQLQPALYCLAGETTTHEIEFYTLDGRPAQASAALPGAPLCGFAFAFDRQDSLTRRSLELTAASVEPAQERSPSQACKRRCPLPPKADMRLLSKAHRPCSSYGKKEPGRARGSNKVLTSAALGTVGGVICVWQ